MPYSAGFRRAIEHAKGVRYLSDSQDPSRPDYESDSYQRMIDAITFMRTVYGGTGPVREAGTTLLPQHPSEDDEDYDRRLTRAVFYNATRRTVSGLVGMMFRKEPQWATEKIPERIANESLNLDMLGHDISVLSRDLATQAVIDGHVWVLVDYPEVAQRPRSAAEERTMGLRPYWVTIRASDAINVQWETVGGVPTLRLFAFRTSRSEPAGEFGENHVEIVRVLRPGVCEDYVRTDNGWMLDGEPKTVTLGYVPVAWIPANETGPFESAPPLLDLAYENIDHYQIRSDHRHAAMFASTPMPVFFGMAAEDLQWGPNRAVFLGDPEARAQILESSGASLASTREDLKDCERRMASLGLQMLMGEKRAAETERAKLIGKAESDSTLSAMTRSLEDGLNRAWEIHCDWLGLEPVAVALNQDFHESTMTGDVLNALSAMEAKGQLSVETLWSAMLAGELLPDSFDPELEAERIAAQDERTMAVGMPVLPGESSDEEGDGFDV